MSDSSRSRSASKGDEAFARFLQRVWQHDVRPLLNDHRSSARQRSARWGGKAGAAGGMVLDRLLGLRGRPFTRSLTVLGASFGAMAPDAWDWNWLRTHASAAQQEAAAASLTSYAQKLELDEALALFDLPADVSRESVKAAWHDAARRWHPDVACDESQRAEHQARFITYRAAYDCLQRAFDTGALPKARA